MAENRRKKPFRISTRKRVNSSVWQTPLALISDQHLARLRAVRGSTISITSGAPAWCATAAFTFMFASLQRKMAK
jgi:hypothetical protein